MTLSQTSYSDVSRSFSLKIHTNRQLLRERDAFANFIFGCIMRLELIEFVTWASVYSQYFIMLFLSMCVCGLLFNKHLSLSWQHAIATTKKLEKLMCNVSIGFTWFVKIHHVIYCERFFTRAGWKILWPKFLLVSQVCVKDMKRKETNCEASRKFKERNGRV